MTNGVFIMTSSLCLVSGSRQTFFASQVCRYADIYASSHLNLLHYPLCYLFKAPAMLASPKILDFILLLLFSPMIPMQMPHESTVHHTDTSATEDEGPLAARSRTTIEESLFTNGTTPAPKESNRQNSESQVPHLYAVTPTDNTHLHDEDSSDDEDEST